MTLKELKNLIESNGWGLEDYDDAWGISKVAAPPAGDTFYMLYCDRGADAVIESIGKLKKNIEVEILQKEAELEIVADLYEACVGY